MAFLNLYGAFPGKTNVVAFHGQEELSRLYSFDVTLECDVHTVDAAAIIGKPFAVGVRPLEDGPERFFHGIASRFTANSSKAGPCLYRLELVPWLWLLTRTADCRVFAKKTVRQIIEKVFEDHPPAEHSWKLTRTYGTWEYCVQYRETDFNFVSRMLEQEGIFYYFQHTKTSHSLVLADSPSGYRQDPDCKDVPFIVERPYKSPCVNSWVKQFRFIPGSYAQTDYNAERSPAMAEETPANLLKTTFTVQDDKPIPHKYEIFDYPAEYETKAEDEVYTRIRMEEEEVAYRTTSGTGVHPLFSAGVRFKLGKEALKHPHETGEFVLLSVQHSAQEYSGAADYSNTFTCIPGGVPFRPARITRKPAIQGAQTAVVVGPKGSEIYADHLGRVRVQFFWDRKGKRLQSPDEEPLPVRVGQISAGKKWGALFIPRVGQEVIVTFLEGDPDWPIITGVVYNGDQTPPYDPETDGATISGIKTCTSPGGNGFNELRFDDRKDQEQIFLHAQKDVDVRVRNDYTERIYGHRHEIVGWEKDGQKGGDHRQMIYQDKHSHVKRHRIDHVEGNLQLMVGNGEAQDGGNVAVVVEKQTAIAIGAQGLSMTIAGDKKEKIDGSQSLVVQGAHNEKLGSLSRQVQGQNNEQLGGQSLKIDQDQQVKIGMNHALEAGMAIHIKAGTTLVLEAGVQLSLKAGPSFVDLGPAGVSISGPLVNINSGGAAGAGAGANPQAPEAPQEASASDAEEAAPTEPDMADTAETGMISTPYG